MKTRASATTSVLVLGLAACSGGGSTAPQVPTAQITKVNARDVARLTLGTFFGIADTAGAITAQLNACTPGTSTLAGPEGGQVILSLDDRDGDELLSSGDACTMSFSGFTVNGNQLTGAAVFDGLVVFGPAGEYTTHVLEARMQILGMSIVDVATTQATTFGGTFALRRDTRVTARVSDLLVLERVTFGESTLLPGSRIARNEYLEYGALLWAEGSRGWFASGAMTAGGVDGILDFATTVPFTGFPTPPYGGELEVRGKSGSEIVIRVVTFAGALEVEADTNGDGIVDETIATPWAQL